MQRLKTNGLWIVLVVAIGLICARASLASPIQPSDLAAALVRAQEAVSNTSINLKFVEEQVQQEGVIVASLEEALAAGSDPETIAGEVQAVGQHLNRIAQAIGDIAAELDSTEISSSRGEANLHPVDDSGVKARIEFVDDGTTLAVNGTATGLDPNESYVTLIYDNGAVPGGPNACVPTIFDPEDPDFLLGTMLIGFWNVDPSGNGTLSAINTNFGADYVRLDRFRATSVRLVLGPPPSPGAPPPTDLMACGRVAARAGK